MSQAKILVTGGAGYIGSHVVATLLENSEDVLVLDNLSSGFRDAVGNAKLIEGDVGNIHLVKQLIHEYAIDSVIHLAAHTKIPESINHPFKYYQNNAVNTLNLLEACAQTHIKHFIFSSTAAVYGNPEIPLIAETHPCLPQNPYGTSKLMAELMLRDYATAHRLNYVVLRYFNVAGANPDGTIGSRKKTAELFISIAAQAALGLRNHVEIFGTDYDTLDGTCIRDYIHVHDIAAAHVNALEYLRNRGESITLNCGYGQGYSVREVLAATQRLSENSFAIREAPRRQGDMPAVIADATKIKNVLNWRPQLNNIDAIIQSEINWQRQLLCYNDLSLLNS